MKIIKEINQKMTELTLTASKSEMQNEAEHNELRKEIEGLSDRVDRYELLFKRVN